MAVPRELYYAVFDTPAGRMGVLGSEMGLRRLILPRPSDEDIRAQLGISRRPAIPSPSRFRDLISRLAVYFAGERAIFPDTLDLADATPFQRRVWKTTRLIPWGETRSYAWVAEQMGQPKAARAVGQALGKNPLPIIIPCHRVLAGSGSLGGFTGGLETKRFLLKLEKAAI